MRDAPHRRSDVSRAGTDSPPRRRPANRRAQILEAAARLFGEQGYPHTSMADIAAAVDVRPSALYRHVPGKQELLAEALLGRLAAYAQAVADLDPADPWPTVARAALDQRGFAALWEREARHLEPGTRRAVAAQVQAATGHLVPVVAAARPDLGEEDVWLLTWLASVAMTSPSYHRVELPGDGLVELLAGIARAVVGVAVPEAGEDRAAGPTLTATSRREELLAAAMRLFAARGFADVGIDDIGAEVGVAGPAIYRHFDRKADLLVAGMTRGAEWLRLDLERAVARSATAAGALRRLVASYVSLSVEHPDLITVMITEGAHLEGTDAQRIRQAQRDHVGAWVDLLGQVHPEESARVARCRAQAVFTMANSATRSQRLHARPDLHDWLAAAAEAALALPVT